MKNIIQKLVLAFGVMGLVVLPLAPTAVFADTAKIQEGIDAAGGDGGGPTIQESIKNIANILLFIIGAVAVIFIIYGGFRYTTSGGDASSTKAAKDTIFYAVIGLMVAIFAFAIVNFVVTSFGG